MSREHAVDTQQQASAKPDQIDPAGLRELAFAVRTFLQFHQQLGISQYPLTEELRLSLKQTEKPEPVSSRAPQKRVPLQSAATEAGAVVPSLPTDANERRKGLLLLEQQSAACTLCGLATARQGQVFGAGCSDASLMIVGDFSLQQGAFAADVLFGADEDAMLWNMMRAIGLDATDVYVTNALKCCPRVEVQPDGTSQQQCAPYLHREIDLVRPHIICVMGDTAIRTVLGSTESVLRLRGKFHEYTLGGEQASAIQVMVTCHPRFLLVHPEMKRAAWQDLQMIQRRLELQRKRKG